VRWPPGPALAQVSTVHLFEIVIGNAAPRQRPCAAVDAVPTKRRRSHRPAVREVSSKILRIVLHIVFPGQAAI
jgi:hypothetical protein